MAGHGEHDDASYVPAEMKKQPFAEDPVARTEKFILEQGLLDPDGLKQMRGEIAKQVDDAIATAVVMPLTATGVTDGSIVPLPSCP